MVPAGRAISPPSGVYSMSFGASEPPQPVETRFSEVVFPEHANHYGTLFAGTALSLMAKAAFAAGARHAGRNVVMVRSDTVEFREPVKVGELIEIVARVVRSGRTSMTVAVEIFREEIASGQRSRAMHGTFEMVAIGEDGRPVLIAKNTTTTV
ncbi:MAG: acyl-CoA thioesterase [Rhizobiales bacterium]|nr:acyl-CoA thioesterase [Hyphomicrobiales bacterium]